MGKKSIPIFFLVILAVVLIGAWPDIQKGKRPVNQFISMAKKSGMIPLVQIVNKDAESEIIAKEVSMFNQTSNTKVLAKAFPASENAEYMSEQGVGSPSYVIYDADGNASVKANSLITAAELTKIISGVHTH